MSTRMPLPTARNAVPRAAVVLPLPGPVLISRSPRREEESESMADHLQFVLQIETFQSSIQNKATIPRHVCADSSSGLRAVNLNLHVNARHGTDVP